MAKSKTEIYAIDQIENGFIVKKELGKSYLPKDRPEDSPPVYFMPTFVNKQEELIKFVTDDIKLWFPQLQKKERPTEIRFKVTIEIE